MDIASQRVQAVHGFFIYTSRVSVSVSRQVTPNPDDMPKAVNSDQRQRNDSRTDMHDYHRGRDYIYRRKRSLGWNMP